MFLKILADENIDKRTIELLKKEKCIIISISELYRGLKDSEVINIAKKEKAIIVTRDKDFGEWVYSFKEKDVGIILLRYYINEINEINNNLIKIIKEYKNELHKKFTVITNKKVRLRNIK